MGLATLRLPHCVRSLRVAALVMASLGVAGSTNAATADGTLVTNVATATFATASTMGFAVSYGASAYVLIANPCVSLLKVPNVTVQSAGGTVTYTLWVVNCSPTTSAFNVTVTDKLPDNVAYDAARGNWNGGSWGTLSTWTSATGVPTAYANVPPAAGQVTPFYMRYLLDQLGPNRSAFLSYSVVIL